MAQTNVYGLVNQDSALSAGEGDIVPLKLSKMGHIVALDWYTQMALEGRVFNVRAGTISVPIAGDLLITDAAAEMCADAQLGYTIMPTYLNIAVNAGDGILHEYAAKSAGAVSTAGTAFVPLNNLIGGPGPATTARAATAGGVTVAAELATTTKRHWNFTSPVAHAAGHDIATHEWMPMAPPTLVGPACFYVQIAASGTGPSYFANFDYVELTTVSVS